jgi:hypothetical protein
VAERRRLRSSVGPLQVITAGQRNFVANDLGGGPHPQDVLIGAFTALQVRAPCFDTRWLTVTLQTLVQPTLWNKLTPTDYCDFVAPILVDLGTPNASRRVEGASRKLKPLGSPAMGLALTLPDRLVLLWFTGKARIQTFRQDIPYQSIREVNQLTYSWKGNTILGLEIGADHWWPLIFSEKMDFTWTRELLHKRLDGRRIPLFKGRHCVRWVVPASEADPMDETGEERHAPYGL